MGPKKKKCSSMVGKKETSLGRKVVLRSSYLPSKSCKQIQMQWKAPDFLKYKTWPRLWEIAHDYWQVALHSCYWSNCLKLFTAVLPRQIQLKCFCWFFSLYINKQNLTLNAIWHILGTAIASSGSFSEVLCCSLTEGKKLNKSEHFKQQLTTAKG